MSSKFSKILILSFLGKITQSEGSYNIKVPVQKNLDYCHFQPESMKIV
jgi:hypothetical protein